MSSRLPAVEYRWAQGGYDQLPGLFWGDVVRMADRLLIDHLKSTTSFSWRHCLAAGSGTNHHRWPHCSETASCNRAPPRGVDQPVASLLILKRRTRSRWPKVRTAHSNTKLLPGTFLGLIKKDFSADCPFESRTLMGIEVTSFHGRAGKS
jgi:hypothetical protein